MANLPPQAKRLIILGLVGVVLVGGALVVNTYFLAPTPPPPAPPVRPVLPPPPRPPVATPAPAPQATPAPAPRPQAAVPSPGLGTPPTPPAPPAATASPATPPPPKPTVAAPAPGSYALQVGAFAAKTNAEKLQKRLEEKGYGVIVRQASPRLPRHRVLVGEYTDQAEAQAQRERVVAAGTKGGKVVSLGGGKYTVEAGTFRELDAAIDLSRELQKSGMASRIDSRPTATGLYQVRVQGYASQQEAQAQVEPLRKEGLSPIVVKN
ncbi:MAG: SPOR domain-containing protein [Candidatus Methylomirabilales bacterium]